MEVRESSSYANSVPVCTSVQVWSDDVKEQQCQCNIWLTLWLISRPENADGNSIITTAVSRHWYQYRMQTTEGQHSLLSDLVKPIWMSKANDISSVRNTIFLIALSLPSVQKVGVHCIYKALWLVHHQSTIFLEAILTMLEDKIFDTALTLDNTSGPNQRNAILLVIHLVCSFCYFSGQEMIVSLQVDRPKAFEFDQSLSARMARQPPLLALYQCVQLDVVITNAWYYQSCRCQRVEKWECT